MSFAALCLHVSLSLLASLGILATPYFLAWICHAKQRTAQYAIKLFLNSLQVLQDPAPR
jgi:hypothetical protein